MRRFWRLFYKAFPPTPPRGKGTRENPLSMADLDPLFKCLDRTGYSAGPVSLPEEPHT